LARQIFSSVFGELYVRNPATKEMRLINQIHHSAATKDYGIDIFTAVCADLASTFKDTLKHYKPDAPDPEFVAWFYIGKEEPKNVQETT
jgi:hypothetical protein